MLAALARRFRPRLSLEASIESAVRAFETSTRTMEGLTAQMAALTKSMAAGPGRR